MNRFEAQSRWCRMGTRFACFTFAMLTVAGCSDVLSVETPDIVDPGTLNTPAGLSALRNGAYGDFVRGFTGDGITAGTDGHIQESGILSDELVSSGTNTSRVQMDARYGNDRNDRIFAYYANLQRARQSSESAIQAFTDATDAPAKEAALAELSLLAGYAYVFFAEDFCSGVPYSGLENGKVVFGEPQTTEETLQRAVTLFQQAADHAGNGGVPALKAAAEVGRGRALLDAGEFDAAADAVADVPTDLVYTVKYSTNTQRQENGIFGIINTEERISAVNREGGNGIDYLDAFASGDPRTPWEKDPRNGVGFDSSVEEFLQLKYTDPAAPIPLATGVEARLIEAERALQSGDVAAFDAIHSDLRATVGLPPLDTSGLTEQERVDVHFRERALWFWIEGHRLGDLRRLVRQYGRAPESVYPSGSYFRPQYTSYGSALTLPVPFQEHNNPNFQGCLSDGA